MEPNEREKLIDAWAAECKELLNAPPLPVELDPMVAIAIISQIQLASRHPENTGWMMTQAVEAARGLQILFNPASVTARVLELGWDASEDVLIDRKTDIGAEISQFPCEDLSVRPVLQLLAEILSVQPHLREVFKSFLLEFIDEK